MKGEIMRIMRVCFDYSIPGIVHFGTCESEIDIDDVLEKYEEDHKWLLGLVEFINEYAKRMAKEETLSHYGNDAKDAIITNIRIY